MCSCELFDHWPIVVNITSFSIRFYQKENVGNNDMDSESLGKRNVHCSSSLFNTALYNEK